MFTIQPAYAAIETGYTVSGDNVTVSTSEISITKTVADSIIVLGVANGGIVILFLAIHQRRLRQGQINVFVCGSVWYI